jgi:LmbE family N-acetylglucosaminyl deacetylase
MRRLLCVVAHPDDEAGGFGGTLLDYKQRGVETHVLCLTPGQAGRHRAGANSDAELAAIRKQEFAASCRLLQVTSGEVLDFPDAGLATVDVLAITGEIVRRIRQLRPHVVLTIGSEGAVTAHPDHSMAGLYTTLAYQWAARTNRFEDQLKDGLQPWRAQKLYWATAMQTLPDRQPVAFAPYTAAIDVEPFFETKLAAFRAHTTQNPLYPYFEKTMRAREKKEFFHLVASTTPRKIEMETDIFAGVVDD